MLNTNTQLFCYSFVKPVLYSSLFSLLFPCKILPKWDLPILPVQNERPDTVMVLHLPAVYVVPQKNMPHKRSVSFLWNIKLVSIFFETMYWTNIDTGEAYIILLAKSIQCAQIRNVNLLILEALAESILAVLRQGTGTHFSLVGSGSNSCQSGIFCMSIYILKLLHMWTQKIFVW